MEHQRPTAGPGSFQTPTEASISGRIAEVFAGSSDPLDVRIATFMRYARRSQVTRLLALYELFKLIRTVKGSIVECGVFRGASLMTWSLLSAALEPTNLTRRIYGLDTFGGFPAVSDKDRPMETGVSAGDLSGSSYDELLQLIAIYDEDRFLGHIPKVSIIRGDMCDTIPRLVADHPHLVVSLLFLDADLYEPTRVALELLLPRMPRGAIVAFDELDNPLWPGETTAALDAVGLNRLRLERFEFDPYIAFARVE